MTGNDLCAEVKLQDCAACGVRWPLMVVVKDRLWKQITKAAKCSKDEVLCFHCMEELLDRPLTFADMKDCGCTFEMKLGAFIAQREGRKVKAAHIPRSCAGFDRDEAFSVMLYDLGLEQDL